jgi:hypothetical protein
MARKVRPPPAHPPIDAAELTPEEQKELIRKFMKDPEAQRRAAQAMADGWFEDAKAK